MSQLSDFQALLPDYIDEPALVVPELLAEFAALAMSQDEQTYREIAIRTALLLRHHGKQDTEAEVSRFTLNLDPMVAISGRVDRIYRAFRLDEPEVLMREAEFLWVTLAARSKDVCGEEFKHVLQS